MKMPIPPPHRAWIRRAGAATETRVFRPTRSNDDTFEIVAGERRWRAAQRAQVHEAPERIYLSTVDLVPDWHAWRESERVEVMRPERAWEGADAPLEPSVRSVAYGHVNQLRDPAIYVEEDAVYLAYAVAGEAGIGLARIWLPEGL